MADYEDEVVADLLTYLTRPKGRQEVKSAALDAHEFTFRPFKVIIRVLAPDRHPMPGAAVLYGAKTLTDLDNTIAAGIQATLEIYADDQYWLETIVLNRNFDKLPALSWVKPVTECMPQP